MSDDQRVFLELKPARQGYEARVHRGDPASSVSLRKIGLGRDARGIVKEGSYALGELIDLLASDDLDRKAALFDERGQLALGQYLYSETLGKGKSGIGEWLRDEDAVLVRVMTKDEDLARLPWALLARGGRFLCATGWSVMLCDAAECMDCALPPSPRILMVMPEPDGVPGTEAGAHIHELEALLSGSDPYLERGQHLALVHTWEDLWQAVADRGYDLLYYYGHGLGDRNTSRLVLATRAGNIRVDIPVADLAQAIESSGHRAPLIAYVNCCSGDAGGFLGAGLQLRRLSPVVVTNRTVATIPAARAQARYFFSAILIEGLPPHTALAQMYTRLGDLDLSLKDTRWMTPVLHGRYGTWRSHPPGPPDRLERDPHWRLKLDRREQYSLLAQDVRDMLREQRPRAKAYLCYGAAGQGVHLFLERVLVQLREDLGQAVAVQDQLLEWPEHLHDPSRAFEHMFLGAFRVRALEDIPTRVEHEAGWQASRQTLLYLRHAPVSLPGSPIRAEALKQYLEWWDATVTPALRGRAIFVLLCIPIEAREPNRFSEKLAQVFSGRTLRLSNTYGYVLGELGDVTVDDLYHFVDTHNIPMPERKKRDELFKKVIDETEGRYEPTLERLKEIEREYWRAGPGGSGSPAPELGGDEGY